MSQLACHERERLATIIEMPRPAEESSIAASRQREKEASRRRDERARASRRKSASRLKRENEVLGGLAASACVRLLASRSLG